MPASLSIGELAERTGVRPATLRSWETRYGAPHPQRLTSGHRRYSEEDVALIQEILRLRASGFGLDRAVIRAGAHAVGPATSVFAGLRRRHPELEPQVLRKSSLLALSRSIEDECCARAENPVLFGGFQRRRFYRQSRPRWIELARTARATVVFADFTNFAEPPIGRRLPVEIPLSAAAPMRREWVLVCDAPDYPACLAAWEHPGQGNIADPQRRFETIWTVDPAIVRDAARICVDLTQASSPSLARRLTELLAGTPPTASADLRRATGLLNRLIGYLEAAR